MADHGAARSPAPPLTYRGDRQRVLTLQAQSSTAATRQGLVRRLASTALWWSPTLPRRGASATRRRTRHRDPAAPVPRGMPWRAGPGSRVAWSSEPSAGGFRGGRVADEEFDAADDFGLLLRCPPDAADGTSGAPAGRNRGGCPPRAVARPGGGCCSRTPARAESPRVSASPCTRSLSTQLAGAKGMGRSVAAPRSASNGECSDRTLVETRIYFPLCPWILLNRPYGPRPPTCQST